MKADKVIILIVIASFLLLGVGVVIAGRVGNSATVKIAENAQAEVNETSFDWGDITLNGGNATKTFAIKNTGTSSLQLANVKTSCMCTTASVTVNGEKSPEFRMHANSSWLGTVEPQAAAQLEVIFDPAFHGPSGVGAISREIIVETNDPKNRQLSFSLSANVVN
ncbi:DUF1573 domain-containing protein [Candidatus Roizmanbacteria bacterium]|nr:DUF1573 domain-containing protein [Candidatus Roizmanbacteria bacterium]